MDRFAALVLSVRVTLGLRVSGTALLLLGRGLLGLAGALLEAEQLGEVSKLLGEHVHMSESGAGWNVEAVAVCDSSGSDVLAVPIFYLTTHCRGAAF